MRMWWRRTSIPLIGYGSGRPVPVVADAAIASQILGEGRLIPLLILDVSQRRDIEDLIKAHQHLPTGDVTSQWGRIGRDKRKINLVLQFQRPSVVSVVLEFDATKQGIIVQSILTSRALYLQPGKAGDRFSSTLDSPRMLAEIPDLSFDEEWNDIWLKAVQKELRRKGLNRREATQGALKIIAQLRDVTALRMRPT